MIKLTFYGNTKPQRQSRTRYEREKEMNDRPAWQLTVKYLCSPSPIMVHACASWRQNDRPAHCPTSLFISPFLSSSAPKNCARLFSVTCRVVRSAYFGQTQRVICFIQKTKFYCSHRTFPYFFSIWIFFPEYVHAAALLQIKSLRDFLLSGGAFLNAAAPCFC